MRKDGLPGVSCLTGALLVAAFFGIPALLYFALSFVVPESWQDVELPCASLVVGMILFAVIINLMQRVERRRVGLVPTEPGLAGEAKLVASKLRERAAAIEHAIAFNRALARPHPELQQMFGNLLRGKQLSIPQEAFLGSKLKLDQADRYALEGQAAKLRKFADELEKTYVST